MFLKSFTILYVYIIYVPRAWSFNRKYFKKHYNLTDVNWSNLFHPISNLYTNRWNHNTSILLYIPRGPNPRESQSTSADVRIYVTANSINRTRNEIVMPSFAYVKANLKNYRNFTFVEDSFQTWFSFTRNLPEGRRQS